MATPANGDRCIPVEAADGQVVPFKITRAAATEDRFVVVQTASGKTVPMKIQPVLSTADRGIPVLCADGSVVLAREAAGGVPGRFFSMNFAGGDICSTLIRYNEDTGAIEPYHNKAGFNATYNILADGFLARVTHGAVVGDDVFVCLASHPYRWDGTYTGGAETGCPELYKYDRVTDTFIRATSEARSGDPGWSWTTTYYATRLLAWGTKLVVMSSAFRSGGTDYYCHVYDTVAGTWVHFNTGWAFSNSWDNCCLWSSGFAFVTSYMLYGSVSSARVYYYDGVSCTQLGSTTFNGAINDLFTDDAGDLYACGAFTTVDGVGGKNRIVKWNTGTSTWDLVGGGIGNRAQGGWSYGSNIVLSSDLATSCGAGGSAKSWTMDAVRQRVLMSYNPGTDTWQYLVHNAALEMGYEGAFVGDQTTPPHAWKDGSTVYLAVGKRQSGTGQTDIAGWYDGTNFGASYLYTEDGSGVPVLTPWLSKHFAQGHGTPFSDSYNWAGRPASTNCILKLAKADPADEQMWFIGGTHGYVADALGDRMPYFDGSAWQDTIRSGKTYTGTRPAVPVPQRGFTVAGRNFYIADAVQLNVSPNVTRTKPLIEFGTVDDDSWAIPAAWTAYMAGDESNFRIWFPDYRFNYYGPSGYVANRYGQYANAFGHPIMHDAVTGKSILHMTGGYCYSDPVDGSPGSNFAGAVEIDWTAKTIAPTAWDHGYADTAYQAHAYCNGNWYAMQISGGQLSKFSGSWSAIANPSGVAFQTWFLAAVSDTQLLLISGLLSGTPSSTYWFYLYDTVSGTFTAQWDLVNAAQFWFRADRPFWTSESGTLYLWGRGIDYADASKTKLAKIDPLGKTIAYQGSELWLQPYDSTGLETYLYPTSEALYVLGQAYEMNGGRYWKHGDGTYLRGTGLFKYNFSTNLVESIDGTENAGIGLRNGNYGASIKPIGCWGDETVDYGNRLIITP